MWESTEKVDLKWALKGDAIRTNRERRCWAPSWSLLLIGGFLRVDIVKAALQGQWKIYWICCNIIISVDKVTFWEKLKW